MKKKKMVTVWTNTSDPDTSVSNAGSRYDRNTRTRNPVYTQSRPTQYNYNQISLYLSCLDICTRCTYCTKYRLI